MTERERIVQTGTICPFNSPAGTAGDLVTVMDFSLNGAGLISENPCAVGSIIRVRIDSNTFWVDSPARVIRCEPAQQGRFWIGCEFVEEALINQPRTEAA
jgi:hypothetical protein